MCVLLFHLNCVVIRFPPALPWGGSLLGKVPCPVLVRWLWLTLRSGVYRAFWLDGPKCALSLTGDLYPGSQPSFF